MGNITLLSQGNLEGLKKQVCECIDHAHEQGYKKGKNEPRKVTNVEDTNEYQIGYKVGYEDRKKEVIESHGEQEYNRGIEDASNLLAYADERFIKECFPSESNWNWFDLNAKYGLAVLIKEFKKWQEKNKKAEEINDYNFIVDSLRNMIDDYGEEKVINALSEFGIEVNNV